MAQTQMIADLLEWATIRKDRHRKRENELRANRDIVIKDSKKFDELWADILYESGKQDAYSAMQVKLTEMKYEAAPVPDPVWDAEKACAFAEWASGNFWQFFPKVNFWSKRNHESAGGYLEQTTAQLIQTFLNRPK